MRRAMRTEKERERDSTPSGKLAELVAMVQHELQLADAREAQEEQEQDDLDGEEGERQ